MDLPKRKSFSPGAPYYIGPYPGVKFQDAAPVSAVEVRRDGGHGKKAEKEIAQKRADYFAASTLVLWDLDKLGVDTA